MRVDRLNREKILERIGLDRRHRIDRGVVDEEVEAIDLSGDLCALPFERREVVQIPSNEDRAAIPKSLTERARLRSAVGGRQIVQKDPHFALESASHMSTQSRPRRR